MKWPFHPKANLGQASFILRRLAWASHSTCTAKLRQLLETIARNQASPDVCAACKANHGHLGGLYGTLCNECLLRPAGVDRNAA